MSSNVTAEVKGGSAHPLTARGFMGSRSDLKIYPSGNVCVRGALEETQV